MTDTPRSDAIADLNFDPKVGYGVAAIDLARELERELAWHKAPGRRTDGEYTAMGKPDGWTWLPKVQMWARLDQDHAQLVEYAEKITKAAADFLRAHDYRTGPLLEDAREALRAALEGSPSQGDSSNTATVANTAMFTYKPGPKCPACGYVESHDENCPAPESREPDPRDEPETKEGERQAPCEHLMMGASPEPVCGFCHKTESELKLLEGA